ncbi:DUF4199 domain-containing protein [Stakelama tenebrarum]|uniref:DUF4199 domain-containing protein n=1 Tax=Stakelama tenebrarum TaxID=2711215 RepID=A0A6G6Y190_9SPHN|nr:DUF4199 domain-containing protein [Sphingosinithalassobacter tenebrarum]QIG78695.1 DUF4199 domain-containing protein [Sphingosinithalassobacter tenebrarum]
MFKTILIYGSIAGLIVGSLLFGTGVTILHTVSPTIGMAIGYTGMLVAFSTIFIAIKRRRDVVQGGVIRFLPALGMGLGITLIAGIFYVVAWEAVLAVRGMDFGSGYAEAVVADMRASGASAAEIARASAEMAEFAENYANPFYRIPVTFSEIAPVGAAISLLTALLLANRNFLPAR